MNSNEIAPCLQSQTNYRTKISFVTALIVFSSFTLSACDFCNCYLGLNPGYNKNTIGFRSSLRYASLYIPAQNLRVTHLGNDTPAPIIGGTLDEAFASFDLFARIYPVAKLQVIADLPYTINTLAYDGMSSTRSAFGDFTIMALYQIVNTRAVDSTSVRHRVFAGGGVKFPTGKYIAPSEVTIPMSDHLYSGTGSTDFIFAASYIGKYQKWGWNADVSYKVNSKNNSDYKFGNTTNLNPRLFYEVNAKTLKIYPHLGAAFEAGEKDEDNGIKQNATGGNLIWGTAGIDFYYDSISLSTDARMPISHNLPDGMPIDKSLLMVSLNIHF